MVTLSACTPSEVIVKVCWKIMVSMSLGEELPPKQKFPRLYTIFLPLYSCVPIFHGEDGWFQCRDKDGKSLRRA